MRPFYISTMGIQWGNVDLFLAQILMAEGTFRSGHEKVPSSQSLRGLDEKKCLQHFLTPCFDQFDGFNITEIFHFSTRMARENKKNLIIHPAGLYVCHNSLERKEKNKIAPNL